jgi:hypothetical protein
VGSRPARAAKRRAETRAFTTSLAPRRTRRHLRLGHAVKNLTSTSASVALRVCARATSALLGSARQLLRGLDSQNRVIEYREVRPRCAHADFHLFTRDDQAGVAAQRNLLDLAHSHLLSVALATKTISPFVAGWYWPKGDIPRLAATDSSRCTTPLRRLAHDFTLGVRLAGSSF